MKKWLIIGIIVISIIVIVMPGTFYVLTKESQTIGGNDDQYTINPCRSLIFTMPNISTERVNEPLKILIGIKDYYYYIPYQPNKNIYNLNATTLRQFSKFSETFSGFLDGKSYFISISSGNTAIWQRQIIVKSSLFHKIVHEVCGYQGTFFLKFFLLISVVTIAIIWLFRNKLSNKFQI
jgi:hypothetical protein